MKRGRGAPPAPGCSADAPHTRSLCESHRLSLPALCARSPLSYLTFFWKPILQYFVFPLQFLFLYSYHPTGPMGDLPVRLEAAWRERHRVSSTAAFEKAATEGQQVGAPSFFASTADAGPAGEEQEAVSDPA